MRIGIRWRVSQYSRRGAGRALSAVLLLAACSALLVGCGASAFTPSASDLASLATAFHAAYDFPVSCQVVVTPGSDRFATDGDTRWAYAKFSPGPTCSLMFAEKPVTDLAEVPPFNNDPTGETAVTVRYTFEKQGSGPWVANAGSGTPFPCPAPNGTPPQAGNGSFPKVVLRAWGLSYAQGCADVFYSQFPH